VVFASLLAAAACNAEPAATAPDDTAPQPPPVAEGSSRTPDGADLAPSVPPAGTDAGDGTRRGESGAAPLSRSLSGYVAFVIGMFGSGAYLVGIWVGLIGPFQSGRRLSPLLNGFRERWWAKVPLYTAGGGGVALVFQLPEPDLVPIQAFIIGCTWPAVVANYLSARQSGDNLPDDVVREVKGAILKTEQLSTLPELPPSQPKDRALEDELAAFLEHSGDTPPAVDDAPGDAPGEPR